MNRFASALAVSLVVMCKPAPVPSVTPHEPGVQDEKDLPNVAGIDFSKFPKWPVLPRKGRSVVVKPGSGPSLAEAVEKAEGGDTILLTEGKHTIPEEILVAKSGISIRSEAAKATLAPASAEVRQCLVLTGDDLWIDGITFDGFGGMPIQVGRRDGSTQKNVVLSRVVVRGGEDGIRTAPIGGKAAKPQISGLLVRDVRLEGQRLAGFNIGEGPATDVRLENVTIEMKGADPGNSGADAIAAENGDNILVNRCTVSGASGDGIDFKATRVCVYNTVVHDLGRNGVKFWRGGDLVNSLVYNTGADAALVFEGEGTYRILHTIVAFHVSYSLTCGYGNKEPIKLTIANSIFYNNASAVWVSATTELAVLHSLFTGSKSGYELAVQQKNGEELYVTREEGWGPLAKDPKIRGNLPLGTDPKFLDPAKGDFGFASGSPALDAGTVEVRPYPPADRRGSRRNLGRAPDLGPDERK